MYGVLVSYIRVCCCITFPDKYIKVEDINIGVGWQKEFIFEICKNP